MSGLGTVVSARPLEGPRPERLCAALVWPVRACTHRGGKTLVPSCGVDQPQWRDCKPAWWSGFIKNGRSTVPGYLDAKWYLSLLVGTRRPSRSMSGKGLWQG